MDSYKKVKNYLSELGFDILEEDEDGVISITDEDKGIKDLMIDCEEPILIIEQFIFTIKSESLDMYKKLLAINRSLVHGAFVLDESTKSILFRDTLQLSNLDKNELEASIIALALALGEHTNDLISFSRE